MHCQPTALREVAPECIREGGTGNGDPMHAQVCSRGPARGILLLRSRYYNNLRTILFKTDTHYY